MASQHYRNRALSLSLSHTHTIQEDIVAAQLSILPSRAWHFVVAAAGFGIQGVCPGSSFNSSCMGSRLATQAERGTAYSLTNPKTKDPTTEEAYRKPDMSGPQKSLLRLCN